MFSASSGILQVYRTLDELHTISRKTTRNLIPSEESINTDLYTFYKSHHKSPSKLGIPDLLIFYNTDLIRIHKSELSDGQHQPTPLAYWLYFGISNFGYVLYIGVDENRGLLGC